MCIIGFGKKKNKKSTLMEVGYKDSLFSFRCLENVPLQRLILHLTYNRVINFYLFKQHAFLVP
jgi:hypothetical protein